MLDDMQLEAFLSKSIKGQYALRKDAEICFVEISDNKNRVKVRLKDPETKPTIYHFLIRDSNFKQFGFVWKESKAKSVATVD